MRSTNELSAGFNLYRTQHTPLAHKRPLDLCISVPRLIDAPKFAFNISECYGMWRSLPSAVRCCFLARISSTERNLPFLAPNIHGEEIRRGESINVERWKQGRYSYRWEEEKRGCATVHYRLPMYGTHVPCKVQPKVAFYLRYIKPNWNFETREAYACLCPLSSPISSLERAKVVKWMDRWFETRSIQKKALWALHFEPWQWKTRIDSMVCLPSYVVYCRHTARTYRTTYECEKTYLHVL